MVKLVVQRKAVSRAWNLFQDHAIDEMVFEECRMQLQTFSTRRRFTHTKKTCVIKTNRVLRIMPNHTRGGTSSEPFQSLCASVVEQRGASISSLSINMIRPNSAPVFAAIRNGDFEAFKMMLSLGQASIRDQDELGASLLMVSAPLPTYVL